jgi:hypothetical protein
MPLNLADANALVEQLHRTHKPVRGLSATPSFENRAARVAPEKQASNARLSAARPLIGVSVLETIMSYSDLLKDPRWQRKRLEILQRDDWKCVECRSMDRTLHVHHKLYRKGAKPWEYSDEELHTLCEDCHEKHHEIRKHLDEALARTGDSADVVLGFAECISWLLTNSPVTGFPIRQRSEQLGEGWLGGFASGVNYIFGSDNDALLGMADSNGMLSRRLVMNLERSVSLEPRLIAERVRGEKVPDRLFELENKSRTTRLSPEELAEWLALNTARGPVP